MIKDTDPERIGKLVGSMRESVRVLNEIRAMKEALNKTLEDGLQKTVEYFKDLIG